GQPQRHRLQLLLELCGRQAAALEAVAGLDDLFDVELEDVAPAELAVRALAPPPERAEAAAALAPGHIDLLLGLVVVPDRLFRLAGERYPHRGHVDEDDHGAGGKRAARLCDAVVAPGRIEYCAGDRARRGLIEQRHAVGVTDHTRELVVRIVRFAFGERNILLG